MNRYFRWFGLEGSFVLTCLMSALALLLAILFPTADRKLCLAAMVLSSLGDIVLMDFRHLSRKLPLPTFPLGAALFMLAHVLYIFAFSYLLISRGYSLFRPGFFLGLVIALASFGAISVKLFSGGRVNWGLFFLCAAYLVIIGANMSVICSFSLQAGGWRLLAALGAILFFASDLLIALDKLLNIDVPGRDALIWTLYPIGQILILIAG